MSQTWLDILKSELAKAIESSGAAVPGAKLRQRVAHAAKAQGLEFPPPEMGKFSEFVERFPADFIVRRIPGSDLLIVPANRPELLGAKETGQSRNARLRQDLFEALTTVSANGRRIAYYVPETDSVAWVEVDQPLPSTAIALPKASLENEIATRRRFAEETVNSVDLRKNLDEVLERENALRMFGEVVRSHGLIREWHVFRMGILTGELRKWSVDNGVAWREEWVESNSVQANAVAAKPTRVPPDSRRQLDLLADGLTTEDLARITVPLDIVLRLLAR